MLEASRTSLMAASSDERAGAVVRAAGAGSTARGCPGVTSAAANGEATGLISSGSSMLTIFAEVEIRCAGYAEHPFKARPPAETIQARAEMIFWRRMSHLLPSWATAQKLLD